jgi:hypothetical protein
MKFSPAGAMVGAVLGAAARAAVVWLNLGTESPAVFVLPSAAVGVLVGLIAGGMMKPVMGAIVGAVLSAVVFEMFMLPCASLIGTFGSITGDQQAQGKFLQATLIYALEMGLAGALAGGIGSLAGNRREAAPTATAEAKTSS